MEMGYSKLRGLILFSIALVTLGIGSNFYVASEISRNSDELDRIYRLLQKQLTGEVLAQSRELQKRMESLNETATGIDAKMKKAQDEMDGKLRKAQDDMVARMGSELPKIMDRYIQSRATRIRGELEKQGIPQP